MGTNYGSTNFLYYDDVYLTNENLTSSFDYVNIVNDIETEYESQYLSSDDEG